MLEVDLKDVDQMVQPEYTPWITNMEVNIDTTMIALPKGSSTLRIRAELEEWDEENLQPQSGENGEQNLHQVIVSRLRMSYTRLNQGYRLDLNPPPECRDCGARLTINHLL
jgi:hypothetical protein